jgi:hypothetical protein
VFVDDRSSQSRSRAGVQAQFGIDFSSVTIGPELIYNTDLGKILRKIMSEGMNRLAQNPRLQTELDWQAQVKDYDANTGTLIFDQGLQSRLAPHQTFTVYAREEGDLIQGCEQFRVVAHAVTTQVDSVSSVALVEKSFGERGVKVGDWVKVRPAEAAGPAF